MVNKIVMKTNTLKNAVAFYDKTLPLQLGTEPKTEIVFSDATKDLLEYLNDNGAFTTTQQKAVNVFLFPTSGLNSTYSSPSDLGKQINFINREPFPVLEAKIGDKWYPVKANVEKYSNELTGTVVYISCYGVIGNLHWQQNFTSGSWDFKDSEENACQKNFSQLFEKQGLRVASKESIEKAKELNTKIIALNAEEGASYDAWGNGLSYHNWFGFMNLNVGHASSPAITIIEPFLEDQHNRNHHYDMSAWHLPFIRVFSLKHKEYIYVDIECIKKHAYHREGREKIVLPPKMFKALNSIFDAKSNEIFGDLFHNRHGGTVVLANGPSGVGKTLTAEVFAEYQERPLYCMEMSEVGTTVKEVEENLQRIFTRAKKWNAVLLFDEADIFLSERQASDLERSAIVGIFLRLLDYYEGTFFLTTNRGDGIDKAFKSRVTLYLNYPELSPETRQTIWKNMIEASQIKIEEDVSWGALTIKPLNGRQIRNQVRLLKMMYSDNVIKMSEVIESLEFAA